MTYHVNYNVGQGKKLSTDPPLGIDFEYDYLIDGDVLYFVFDVITEPNTKTTFPYNLRIDFEFLGTTYKVTGGKLKEESPSTWSAKRSSQFPSPAPVAAKACYKISPWPKTLTFQAKVYSTQTSGAGWYIGYLSFPTKSDSRFENIKVKVGGVWKDGEKVYVKADGSWKEAEKVYIKVNGVWKEV